MATQAQADSVHEWGNWDSTPPVQATEFHFEKQSFVATAEQQRIGTNKGDLVTASEDSTWIGYVNTYVSSMDPVNEGNKVAVLHLTPVVLPADENLRMKGLPGSLNITSDTAAFNMSFDSKANNTGTDDNYRYFAFYNGEEGSFNGRSNSSSTVGSVTQSNSQVIYTEAGNLNSENNGQYFSYLSLGTSTYSNNSDTHTSKYSGVYGDGFIGKVMPLADIAAQTRLGATYTFNGYSRNSGSSVDITVKFANASWSGTWGGDNKQQGFDAAGNISGATLTSTSLTGSGTSSSSTYVQGGKVTGTLIGVMNDGANSNAGIIGKTELNVVAAGATTVKVNDVFQASIVNNTKR